MKHSPSVIVPLKVFFGPHMRLWMEDTWYWSKKMCCEMPTAAVFTFSDSTSKVRNNNWRGNKSGVLSYWSTLRRMQWQLACSTSNHLQSPAATPLRSCFPFIFTPFYLNLYVLGCTSISTPREWWMGLTVPDALVLLQMSFFDGSPEGFSVH